MEGEGMEGNTSGRGKDSPSPCIEADEALPFCRRSLIEKYSKILTIVAWWGVTSYDLQLH